jgi:hypothetical protein
MYSVLKTMDKESSVRKGLGQILAGACLSRHTTTFQTEYTPLLAVGRMTQFVDFSLYLKMEVKPGEIHPVQIPIITHPERDRGNPTE